MELWPASKQLSQSELVSTIKKKRANGANNNLVVIVSQNLSALQDEMLVSGDRTGNDKRTIYYKLTPKGKDKSFLIQADIFVMGTPHWRDSWGDFLESMGMLPKKEEPLK